MTDICILCGEPFGNKPTNREHYVPAVAIRNFDKLRIPKKFDHALRINLSDANGEAFLTTIKNHKVWATVRTHTQCNTDASHMCQDMAYIIRNPHSYPKNKEKSIKEYYKHIWKLDKNKELAFYNLTDEQTDKVYKGKDYTFLYSVGQCLFGKIFVVDESPRTKEGYEQHYILIGTRQGLEDFLREIGRSAKIVE